MRAMLLLTLLAGGLFLLPAAPSRDETQSQAAAAENATPEDLSVRQFGAVGDGAADDTAAIRRAVAEGTGQIVFPSGSYRLTETIVIELDRAGPVSLSGQGTARIVMDGPGPAFRFVGTHQGTAAPSTVQPAVWERQRMPLIDGLEIVGGHPEADGIEATGTMQAVFSRLLVRNTRHAVHLTERNRNVILSECHLYENSGIGLFLDGVNLHQINIANCHISYNRQGGVVVRGSEVRNLQIGTCDIEGNMGPDGQPTANILFDTRQGTMREGAIVGCTIQHSHEAPGSANIRLLGRSPEQPQKVGNLTIADNALSDVAVNVHLKYARGVTLVGNTFWKGFEHNLLVEGSSDITVGENLFDRNPDYRPRNSRNTLLFRDCADCTLSGLHVKDAQGVGLTLRNCRRFNVTGCTLLDCDAGGLRLDGVHRSRVSDCLIQTEPADTAEAFSPIRVTGGQGNMIAGNLVSGRIRIEEGTAVRQDNRNVTGDNP